MTGITQTPTDWRKYIDEVFYAYQPKIKKLRTLFAEQQVDSAQTTLEYAKMTQTYAEARGYDGFDAGPELLADGSSPRLSSFGTSDATSSPSTHGRAFLIDRKLLNSGLPFQQAEVARHSMELMNVIENDVNVTLNTNLASNAGQTYTATGGTWATTGDPVADVQTAKTAFKKASGGLDADFIAVNPSQLNDISTDFRFQNTLYSTGGKVLDGGTITPKPLGLDWIDDTAVTAGTFFMGKKGMFGRLLISENYKTYQKDLGSVGMEMQAIFSYVDQYPLPNYLLYGTGV
mgnify:CR=1 FL=1